MLLEQKKKEIAERAHKLNLQSNREIYPEKSNEDSIQHSQVSGSNSDMKARVELHPALLALQQDPSISSSKLTSLVPKFATTKANIKMQEAQLKKQQEREKKLQEQQKELQEEKTDKSVILDFKNNPYFDASLQTKASLAPKTRSSRKLKFVEHGRFIEQANKMRAEEQLERLKQQIAETAVKTGLEQEINLAVDSAIREGFIRGN